ncbi:MAG TPA: hypothetical protein VMX56_01250 [Anaerolineales bacterium]|nr:hypothetical protein [Anaerolineales bacterium]
MGLAVLQKQVKQTQLDWLQRDTVDFVRSNFPDMDMLDQAVMIRALWYDKRVCVWRNTPTVYSLHPPAISTKDTLDLHYPAGEYDSLVIIDLGLTRR